MLRRLASLALACGFLAGVVTPATAFSYWCSYDGSTRLLTAQDRSLRVWVQEGPYGSTSVCFLVGDTVAGSLDLYFVAPAAYDPDPTVETPSPECAEQRVDVAQDPVPDPVTVTFQADADLPFGGRTICLGFGDTSATIGVTLPAATSPFAAYLTLDRDKRATDAYCAARPEAVGCAGGYAEIRIL